jgi:hypothetical protein
MDSIILQKKQESQMLAEQVEQFLKKGGSIKVQNAFDREKNLYFPGKFVNKANANKNGIKYDHFRDE